MPALTVTEYLAATSADRCEALNRVRRGINRACRRDTRKVSDVCPALLP